MDRVTLKHYEERAAKARALVKRIEELEREIKRAKVTFSIRIYALGSGKEVEVGEWDQKNKSPNNFRTKLAACMVNVFIDMTTQEIIQLEQELSEL